VASKCLLSLFTAILLLLSSSALGQDKEGEVFGGFSYLNADLGTRENFFGWQVSISDNFNINENIGLVFDVGGQYKSFPLIRDLGFSVQSYQVLLGPRFMVRGERVTWFVHTLVGLRFVIVAEPDEPDFVPTPEEFEALFGETFQRLVALFAGVSDNAFVLGFGGGMDVNVSDSIAIRVFQSDYMPNRSRGMWHHDVRIGSGIVFKWNY